MLKTLRQVILRTCCLLVAVATLSTHKNSAVVVPPRRNIRSRTASEEQDGFNENVYGILLSGA